MTVLLPLGPPGCGRGMKRYLRIVADIEGIVRSRFCAGAAGCKAENRESYSSSVTFPPHCLSASAGRRSRH